jgi:hypothetical protein
MSDAKWCKVKSHLRWQVDGPNKPVSGSLGVSKLPLLVLAAVDNVSKTFFFSKASAK